MDLRKIKYRKAKLIPQESNFELFGPLIESCHFCGKQIRVTPHTQLNNRFAKQLHCTFCIRNNFHTANSANVAILTFKNLIGYFYFEKYLRYHSMYISEIENYVKWHEITGLENICFFYDPHTMYWFIDFNKIGDTKKKLSLEEVLKNIVNILVCFNLTETAPEIRKEVLFDKYSTALTVFEKTMVKSIIMPSIQESLHSYSYWNSDERKFKNFELKSIDK